MVSSRLKAEAALRTLTYLFSHPSYKSRLNFQGDIKLIRLQSNSDCSKYFLTRLGNETVRIC